MHLNLIVKQLVFSIFLIDIVVCIEPITMTALGTAIAGIIMTSCFVFFIFWQHIFNVNSKHL